MSATSPLSVALASLEALEADQVAQLEETRTAIAAVRKIAGSPAPGRLLARTAAPRATKRKTNVPDPEPRHSTKGDTAKDAILAALARGPMTPGALAAKLGVERPAVRYHVKQLEASGALVSTGSTGTRQIALATARRPKEAP